MKKITLKTLFSILAMLLFATNAFTFAPTIKKEGQNDAVNTFSSPSDRTLSNVKVDKFTGSLNYSFPIEVPQGRGAISPKVILSYNVSSG